MVFDRKSLKLEAKREGVPVSMSIAQSGPVFSTKNLINLLLRSVRLLAFYEECSSIT